MVVGKVLKKPNPFLAIPATVPGKRSGWFRLAREYLPKAGSRGWAGCEKALAGTRGKGWGMLWAKIPSRVERVCIPGLACSLPAGGAFSPGSSHRHSLRFG
jgi:hypothetical protein